MDNLEALRGRVEELAQLAHGLRRHIDDADMVTTGDLPGVLLSAANLLDWAVDLLDYAPVAAQDDGAPGLPACGACRGTGEGPSPEFNCAACLGSGDAA